MLITIKLFTILYLSSLISTYDETNSLSEIITDLNNLYNTNQMPLDFTYSSTTDKLINDIKIQAEINQNHYSQLHERITNSCSTDTGETQSYILGVKNYINNNEIRLKELERNIEKNSKELEENKHKQTTEKDQYEIILNNEIRDLDNFNVKLAELEEKIEIINDCMNTINRSTEKLHNNEVFSFVQLEVKDKLNKVAKYISDNSKDILTYSLLTSFITTKNTNTPIDNFSRVIKQLGNKFESLKLNLKQSHENQNNTMQQIKNSKSQSIAKLNELIVTQEEQIYTDKQEVLQLKSNISQYNEILKKVFSSEELDFYCTNFVNYLKKEKMELDDTMDVLRGIIASYY